MKKRIGRFRYSEQDVLRREETYQVYVGVCAETSIPVAVKVTWTDTAIQNCYNEFRVLQSLPHPNISQPLCCQLVGGKLFTVYQHGVLSLASISKAGLQEADLAYFLLQISSACFYLNNNGRKCQGITPENVLVANGRLKLVTYQPGRVVSKSSEFECEVEYLSPNLIKGEESDQGDVWAFGVMVFQLVKGKRPFKGRICSQVYKSMKLVYPKVDQTIGGVLKSLVLNCFAKKVEKRWDWHQISAHLLLVLSDIKGYLSLLLTFQEAFQFLLSLAENLIRSSGPFVKHLICFLSCINQAGKIKALKTVYFKKRLQQVQRCTDSFAQKEISKRMFGYYLNMASRELLNTKQVSEQLSISTVFECMRIVFQGK